MRICKELGGDSRENDPPASGGRTPKMHVKVVPVRSMKEYGGRDVQPQCYMEVVCLKRDGTRAETRFRLSPKRTIPFKSAGASVQSAAGSRGVRISGSNASNAVPWLCEEYWLTNPFASFPLTSPPVRHRVPSHFNRTVADQNIFRHKRVEVT